jgi:hypothetical protein
VQLPTVILYGSHFNTRILPDALLECVELLHVWHLGEYGVNSFLEANLDGLQLLLHRDVMIVELQLLLQGTQVALLVLRVEL